MTTKRSGAWLVRHALEQFRSPPSRSPGSNTEIYDELNRSERIHPVLVTHEGRGFHRRRHQPHLAPRGDRVLVIVPAAGLTHAMSGIGEAFLDGIPMLIISGGTRTDVPFGFQLHELDQHKILAGLSKGSWLVKEHRHRPHHLRGLSPGGERHSRASVRGGPGQHPVLPGGGGPASGVPAVRPAGGGAGGVARRGSGPAGGRALARVVRVGGRRQRRDRADRRSAGSPGGHHPARDERFPGHHPLHTGMGFSAPPSPLPKMPSAVATVCWPSAPASGRSPPAASAAWSPRRSFIST